MQIKNPNHFFPGIYKFQFSFIGNVNDIGICNIEIHINDGFAKDLECLVAVFIESSEKVSPPVRQFIEEICTKVRYCYFDRLLNEVLTERKMLDEEEIRWFEVIPDGDGKNTVNEVKMNWDKVRMRYKEPNWFQNIQL